MPKFVIKQIHTSAVYFEIEADSQEEALELLDRGYESPSLEDFLFHNDRSDWEITVDEE